MTSAKLMVNGELTVKNLIHVTKQSKTVLCHFYYLSTHSRQNTKTREARNKYKINFYADYVTVYMTDPENSSTELTKVLNYYSKASGYNNNLEKNPEGLTFL